MNLDPDPSSSDSSDDSHYRRKQLKDKKHQKDDSSEPSSSDDSDLSNDSHYRRKRCKDKKHQKKYPIRLCATLMKKLMTTAYKLNIIRFKMDEEPLQRRLYFLTFIDSIDMIFYQYRETCEVLLDYPKIGGEHFKYDAKQAIRNLLHANSDVHSRILIAEFPKDGIKVLKNCSHIVQT